jgi:hypothetical protein
MRKRPGRAARRVLNSAGGPKEAVSSFFSLVRADNVH